MYFVALNFYSNKTDKVSEEIDEAKKKSNFLNWIYSYVQNKPIVCFCMK